MADDLEIYRAGDRGTGVSPLLPPRGLSFPGRVASRRAPRHITHVYLRGRRRRRLRRRDVGLASATADVAHVDGQRRCPTTRQDPLSHAPFGDA